MEIKVLPLGHIGTNCYLVSGEKGAVIIDPGFDSPIVTEFLKENSHKEKLIILTHAHFDHIGAAPKLRKETDTKIAIGVKDNPALSDVNINLATLFNSDIEPFTADIMLYNGDEFTVGDLCFKVIDTPGHTVGGICLLSDDILFSGDTLFYQSVGRTDLPGGNLNTLINSVKKLFELNGDTTVYPGHGKLTTIDHEKKYNPYVNL